MFNMMAENWNHAPTGLMREFWVEEAPHDFPFLTSLLGNTLSKEPGEERIIERHMDTRSWRSAHTFQHNLPGSCSSVCNDLGTYSTTFLGRMFSIAHLESPCGENLEVDRVYVSLTLEYAHCISCRDRPRLGSLPLETTVRYIKVNSCITSGAEMLYPFKNLAKRVSFPNSLTGVPDASLKV